MSLHSLDLSTVTRVFCAGDELKVPWLVSFVHFFAIKLKSGLIPSWQCDEITEKSAAILAPLGRDTNAPASIIGVTPIL
jgi:hypothetical protein